MTELEERRNDLRHHIENAPTPLPKFTLEQFRLILERIAAESPRSLLDNAFGCSEKPSRAARDFSESRSRRSSVLAQHFIVSFKPGEITPERALEVGKEICQKFLDDQYQFLLTVHVDKQHIHLHCLFNHTNLISGYTFQTLNNQVKVSERMWNESRQYRQNRHVVQHSGVQNNALTRGIFRKHCIFAVRVEISQGMWYYNGIRIVLLFA